MLTKQLLNFLRPSSLKQIRQFAEHCPPVQCVTVPVCPEKKKVDTCGSDGKPPFTNWYDTLPKPKGDWKTCNDARESTYNKVLALGVLFAIGSYVITLYTTGFDMNYDFPANGPADDQTYD